MNQLIRTLLDLALAWSAHTAPLHLPDVEIVPSERMPCACMGFFQYATRYSGYAGVGLHPARLLLRADVDLATAYGQSILLHELVHALQAVHGPAAYGTKLWFGREREAYRIQYRFLRASGLTSFDETIGALAQRPLPVREAHAETSGLVPGMRGSLSAASSRGDE